MSPWSQRASANIDTETGNMQTVVKDDNLTLCLWANFKKNPRSVEERATIYVIQERISNINSLHLTEYKNLIIHSAEGICNFCGLKC